MKKNSALSIEHLRVGIGEIEILKDISFSVGRAQIHAVMGPNGSGKSTLAYALMGHPAYLVDKKSRAFIQEKNILDIPTEERAKSGLFLAFQSPIAIPGVSVMNLLRTSYQELYGTKQDTKKSRIQNPLLSRRWSAGGLSLSDFTSQVREHAKSLLIDEGFLSRAVHDGFSGGEKKKIEMLQALTLAPRFAIFDEIDTGLDVDALRVVARGIGLLTKKGTGVIIITHYQRILKYLKPDVVHVLVKGKIVKTGGARLAAEIEKSGYQKYL